MAASAACASSGTSAAAAPRASACSTKSAPPPTATNRSPSAMRRESICRPVTASAHGRAIRRPSGSSDVELERDHRVEHLACDRTVVERDEPPGDLHLGIGPLAGNHDDIAFTRVGECLLDRGATVDDDLQPAVRDLLGDRLRVLAPRVVGRDDHAVGALGGDASHQRPLLAIAVAAGAEHDGEPPRTELARGAQHVVERVGRVRVVDDDAEGLAHLDGLEAAGNAGDGFEALPDGIGIDAERVGRSNGTRRVLAVESAAQPQLGAELVGAGECQRARAARRPAASPTRRRRSRRRHRPGRRAPASQRSTHPSSRGSRGDPASGW